MTFFVANSCLNGSSFLILRATQSQNMFTRLQMKSRYSFQGILSSGFYLMIPTHFKNWRKWCAYCKYITPLNNVSFFFLLSRKIAKKSYSESYRISLLESKFNSFVSWSCLLIEVLCNSLFVILVLLHLNHSLWLESKLRRKTTIKTTILPTIIRCPTNVSMSQVKIKFRLSFLT